MHRNPLLTEQRARRMLDQRIHAALYTQSLPLHLSSWSTPDEPVPFATAREQEYLPCEVGSSWGLPWRTTWIHATGQVPEHWRNIPEHDVELVIDLGFTTTQPGFQAEGLVRRADGSAIKGIHPFNQAVPWAREPDAIDIYLEAASNPDVSFEGFHPTPLGRMETAGTEPLYTLRRVDVALRNRVVWELAQDLNVLLELAADLPENSTRRAQIDVALDAAMDALDPRHIAETAKAARKELEAVLQAPAQASAHHLMATGHAHIDSAWLWPVRETKRKCVRTFSSVLALMDEDPEFVFACSSAQQYLWVKESQPELYERMKQRIAEGRFVPVGGMWVESDTNMPGSEALARQLIEGKSFFLEEFGVETQDVWLPDSFGYTGSLPQIIRASGSRWFLSQKLSWNDTDAMPHHTFDWEGIDGSRILTHFPPVDSYNSRLAVADVRHAEENFAEKGLASSSIVPFGWGDGGGGPTREMLAAAHRMENLEGTPTLEIASPNAFFQRTEDEFRRRPVWSGEMYLQFHRGTYTSQLRTKQGNRRSEHLLREAELWAAAAYLREGLPYPYDTLQECWRTVLRNQFHDILPGSCIGWVYDRVEEEYAQVAAELEEIISDSVRALVGDGETLLLPNAAPALVQGVSSLAIARPAEPANAATVRTEASGVVLENRYLRVTIDDDGLLASVYDKERSREVLSAGCRGALLQLHHDAPRQWDAWDIDREYRNTVEDVLALTELSTAQDGADAVVTLRRPVGEASSVEQSIRLRPDAKQVEFSFSIDWHERLKLLKLAFPVDVMAAVSTAEMQFGHVQRPTHDNTSWDAAQYEICAHRWIHVGEEGYGVAVLNDSTYGHDVTRDLDAAGKPSTTVRLSLVRAPLFPDPEADQGKHTLRVALRPGAQISDAVTEGYAFNLPSRSLTGGQEVEPLVDVEGEGIVLESIKLASDRSGDLIVRLYEALGARTELSLRASFETRNIVATDLLERPLDGDLLTPLPGGRLGVRATLRPFQILTVRISR